MGEIELERRSPEERERYYVETIARLRRELDRMHAGIESQKRTIETANGVISDLRRELEKLRAWAEAIEDDAREAEGETGDGSN